jgi:excisionase family DNA binding protein
VDLVQQVNDMEFLTVEDIQKILRVGKNQAYKLCQRGDFPVMKLGTHYRIPIAEFEKWCERQSYKE